MWTFEYNLNVSLFLSSDDFPDFEHKVTEAWKEGDLILFPANGAFYIAKIDKYYSFIDGEYTINVVDPFFDNVFMYKRSGSWFLNDGIPKGQKFLYLGGVNGKIYQEGEYKLDNGVLKPEYMEHSEEDQINDIPFIIATRIEVYKSSSLIGNYEWQGEDEEDEIPDLIVGWHSYRHTKLDNENEPTIGEVTVFEGKQLTSFQGVIGYKYNGLAFTYTGDFEQNNFVMSSGDTDLNMIFDGLVSYPKDIWKFGGGAQNVD